MVHSTAVYTVVWFSLVGIRPQKCRLDIQPRQGAYCGCGPDYFIHGCAILQEGGANDKEELHRTSPSDGRLPASSSDPLRIVTRWIPTYSPSHAFAGCTDARRNRVGANVA